MYNEADSLPRRIGRYDVVGELGHGGMAVVYRAHDPRLQREVAVKVLHPHLARDAESRARFEREARAAARLRHPAIVEVYEFSDASERESYMVTELLEGPTLRRFAEQHPGMLPEVVAAIGTVLCDALGCAHAQGVVHRDVKPDNVLLQSGGRLKLTDFGIAHVADMREMTATGQVLGSPAHMAPEQIEGDPVDARTDVFATGTVLYLLAVGKLPFDATNAQALLRKILDGDYPDPVRTNPVVGERFAGIIRRAMARIPGERYPDMAAMRADLVRYMSEVGWEIPERELSRYFGDPEGFTQTLRETLTMRLPELGVRARAQGDIPAAMGYFNRALALDPTNPKALAMVRSVARRRAVARRLRATGIVTAVAVLTAGIVTVANRPRSGARVRVLGTPRVADRSPRAAGGGGAVVAARASAGTVVRSRGTATDAAVPVVPVVPFALRTRVHRAPTVLTVDAGVLRTREIVLVPTQRGVRYSVNGGTEQEWDSQHASLGFFAVGRPVRVVVRPLDSGFAPYVWDHPVTSEPGPLRIHAYLRPVNTQDATAAVAPETVPRPL